MESDQAIVANSQLRGLCAITRVLRNTLARTGVGTRHSSVSIVRVSVYIKQALRTNVKDHVKSQG